MVKDKLINLISETLSIDKTLVFEDANLRSLCLLSNYLEGLDKVDKKKIKINKDSLKKNVFENVTYKGNYLFADISFLFERKENKSVIYKDLRGRDGFYNFEILEVLLILEIESKFDIQIPDEDWDNILTVDQALNSIEEAIK
ncbi:hypothetical protein MWU50_07450 [Flavobacteriaceae bacterium S0862]|nr:hypothetical protein [Flavobacteriaceae bacterium S0862]